MLNQPTYKDWITSITKTKVNLLDGIEDEYEEKYVLEKYSPYLINKQLSKNIRYLFLINALGQYKNLDKKMHYQFLLNAPIK